MNIYNLLFNVCLRNLSERIAQSFSTLEVTKLDHEEEIVHVLDVSGTNLQCMYNAIAFSRNVPSQVIRDQTREGMMEYLKTLKKNDKKSILNFFSSEADVSEMEYLKRTAKGMQPGDHLALCGLTKKVGAPLIILVQENEKIIHQHKIFYKDNLPESEPFACLVFQPPIGSNKIGHYKVVITEEIAEQIKLLKDNFGYHDAPETLILASNYRFSSTSFTLLPPRPTCLNIPPPHAIL